MNRILSALWGASGLPIVTTAEVWGVNGLGEVMDRPRPRLRSFVTTALTREGARLLDFAAPEVSKRDIQVIAPKWLGSRSNC